MDIIQERADKYFKEKGINLTDSQKEKIKNVAEKVIDFLKKFIREVIDPVWIMFKKIFNSIDWDKYKRYLKYKKRVKNRSMLYAKRKSRYGKC